jgi:acetylornithine aminotransferase/acetylornithine/N-succinyldiaminopimelate aminotransferase
VVDTVLKIGGELLETDDGLRWIAAQIVQLAAQGPLVVVHGGGRSIDAELARRGVATRSVDGLRITDEETLDAVLCVLAGRVNTRLVASVGAAGGRAVGLTGADAGLGRASKAAPLRSTRGDVVDLGLVGEPAAELDVSLLADLCAGGAVPIVASLGVAEDGSLLNVNADTFAAAIASGLRAGELIVAGATPGVLDADERTIPRLDGPAASRLIDAGAARDGMVTKLGAALAACSAGVGSVRIVDGRGPVDLPSAAGTVIVAASSRGAAADAACEDRMITGTASPNEVQALEAAHLLPVYRRAPVVFVRGEGSRLYDAAGRSYLDCISGVGVASLGHAHPELARALAEQAATLAHTSNLYYHPLQAEVARRLAALSGLPRAFFCNSGTEAVEACLKFARRYWRAQGDHTRTRMVAFEHGFHGRTAGSLSVTWDAHYREPFEPLVPDVTFVSPTDAHALAGAVTSQTVAIIVEPIQGEGGVRPIPAETVRAIAEASARTGALVVADEVQSGLGRTGAAFYSPVVGLQPDVMAVGKALGAGMPVAAALFSERVAAAAQPGDHGSTYGGNLLACRAALVFLEELTERGLLDRIRNTGRHLSRALRELASRHPAIVEVRGAGLMWGLELDRDAGPVIDAARERGLLVNRTAGTVVRLLPPLTIDVRDVGEAVALLDAALADAIGRAA